MSKLRRAKTIEEFCQLHGEDRETRDLLTSRHVPNRVGSYGEAGFGLTVGGFGAIRELDQGLSVRWWGSVMLGTHCGIGSQEAAESGLAPTGFAHRSGREVEQWNASLPRP